MQFFIFYFHFGEISHKTNVNTQHSHTKKNLTLKKIILQNLHVPNL